MNIDTNVTLSQDTNITVNENNRVCIPIEIELISQGTCYDRIMDTNASDILIKNDICEEKDHIYQNTGIYPD